MRHKPRMIVWRAAYMTCVAILPVPDSQGKVAYQAVSGEKRSEGRTAGEALDALAAQLPEGAVGTLLVVQYGRPDEFFTAAHQARLAELMDRWRSARERGGALARDEQAELDA